jgi:putative redox protein
LPGLYVFLEDRIIVKTEKINFRNRDGVSLSAQIDFPDDDPPRRFALFAHCFTCNKDFHAVRNISRALSLSGFGVMRFDFTGLGDSGGEFEDSTFSNNIQDLIAAADFLGEKYKAPGLLIGHSLGGAAVIYAAGKIDSVKAVATVGAPAEPKELAKLFTDSREKIEQQGFAEVSIGGKNFTIPKQFIDDLENTSMKDVLRELRKAIFIAHSPQDSIVDIKNAADIYRAAYHPKSFLSLDGADHLLSDEKDSLYTGNMFAVWAGRYMD